jgi:hypothetical protein
VTEHFYFLSQENSATVTATTVHGGKESVEPTTIAENVLSALILFY